MLAPTYADTDWPQIAELYRLLEMRWPTPVVRVNRAVAVAEMAGPQRALACSTSSSAAAVERWHLYWSTRAELQRRLGDMTAAAESYRGALDCPSNDSDRRFLQRRLAEIDDAAPSLTGK